MSFAILDHQVSSIAQLFLKLWSDASHWDPRQRSGARKPASEFAGTIQRALALPTELMILTELQRLLTPVPTDIVALRGVMLMLMREIDLAYYAIHPRAVLLNDPALRHSVPDWLANQRDYRREEGCYGEESGKRLIPRGPLGRFPRTETASNADELADRFAALSVVPVQVLQSERPVQVVHQVISADVVGGISHSCRHGSEVVAFVPVAEGQDDIQVESRECEGRQYAKFDVAPDIQVADLIVGAALAAGQTDIVMAPEFVVSPPQADRLASELRRNSEQLDTRVVVAGTGLTAEHDGDNCAWNEARVLNGCGTELWRQRKLWPAGLTRNRALECSLEDPGSDQILEDTACGEQIVIVDADTFGRCVILICQDIMAYPLANELVHKFQVDWVFTPILDSGVGPARWTHSRTFELSATSQARFLVSSSTTMAHWRANSGDGAVAVPCGMAVGPRDPAGPDLERAFALAMASGVRGARFGRIAWRSADGTWQQTTVGSAPTVPVLVSASAVQSNSDDGAPASNILQ